MIQRVKFLLAGIFLMPLIVCAQSPLTITAEHTKKGDAIYVSSTAYCPISFSMSLEMDNAIFDYDKQPFFVVPARAQHIKLGDVKIYDKAQAWRYTWQVKQTSWGDLRMAGYDSGYEYALPWQKGLSFPVIQGYDGAFSHQGIYALDFGMPEGTAVLAAREGTIMEVVQEYSIACLDDSCKTRGNRVVVYQPDGTMTTYAHIMYNGATVKVGDAVKKGDTLAYSGNTGFSAGPHLHFSCDRPGADKPISIATKFNTSIGTAPGYLLKDQWYKKEE